MVLRLSFLEQCSKSSSSSGNGHYLHQQQGLLPHGVAATRNCQKLDRATATAAISTLTASAQTALAKHRGGRILLSNGLRAQPASSGISALSQFHVSDRQCDRSLPAPNCKGSWEKGCHDFLIGVAGPMRRHVPLNTGRVSRDTGHPKTMTNVSWRIWLPNTNMHILCFIVKIKQQQIQQLRNAECCHLIDLSYEPSAEREKG